MYRRGAVSHSVDDLCGTLSTTALIKYLADIGLADVDFEVDLDLDRINSQECLRLLSFEKCCTTN